MKRFFTRRRLAMPFAVIGIALMGVDILATRNFFVHVGELMAASLACFVVALVLDRTAKGTADAPGPLEQTGAGR
jgi:ABC-type proline/glycine betaine transport system permease subunit